jgi:UDP-glucose 4-epimerase
VFGKERATLRDGEIMGKVLAPLQTVFVAGGGGFLGGSICAAFLQKGWQVVSIGLGRPVIAGEGLHHHEGLVTRQLLSAAAQAHGSPALVVHAAGGSSVGQSWESPRSDFDLSVGSTAEILDFMRSEAPFARLTLVSSAAVYGNVSVGMIGEDAPCLPVSPYGAHKRVCEELVLAEGRMSGIGIGIVRFFSLFGNGLRKQILWDVMRRASQSQGRALELWGDGMETRDFLHVEDAARLIFLAGTTVEAGQSRIFNGASGRAVSVKELVELLLQQAGIAAELQFNGKQRVGDPRHLTADVSRAQVELGFGPRVTLLDGLSRYASWFRAVQAEQAKE